MANTFKSVTSGSIGTTLTGVYTCPSSTTSIVLGASMANTHSSPIGGSIKLKKDGTSAGEDDVFISRLRVRDKNKVCLWIVSDNLRKGAALNSVQIGELLIKKYL